MKQNNFISFLQISFQYKTIYAKNMFLLLKTRMQILGFGEFRTETRPQRPKEPWAGMAAQHVLGQAAGALEDC